VCGEQLRPHGDFSDMPVSHAPMHRDDAGEAPAMRLASQPTTASLSLGEWHRVCHARQLVARIDSSEDAA